MPSEQSDITNALPFPSDQRPGESAVELSEESYVIYQCRVCTNTVLALYESGGEVTCHDEPMERVEDLELEVRSPDIRQVLLDAFGLPKAGLDICLCVIGDGPISTAGVADELDFDESTVRTYLNDLVEFGLLERSQLNREDGGYVNVYHSIDLDAMRSETLVGFFAWAGKAAALIEAANATKAEYDAGDGSGTLQEVFWERFDAAE